MSPTPPRPQVLAAAARVLNLAREAGVTVTTAESLTGGLLCATLVAIPGASDVVRGGIVAYDADLKTSLLGVPRDLIRAHTVVSPEVAVAMAHGARRAGGSHWGVATTGVAGPGAHAGRPAGTFVVAVAGPARAQAWVERDGMAGTEAGGGIGGGDVPPDDARDRVRWAAVEEALALLERHLTQT